MRRRYDKEMMDDMSVTDERLDRALDELRIINIALGGRSTSRKGIAALLHAPERGAASHATDERGAPAEERRHVTLLDIGAGGSDLFASRDGDGTTLDVISLDLNAGVCRYVRAHDARRMVICADARALPLRENSVDVVHVSLFLHHFTEEEIVRMLETFLRIARVGVVVNDLQRSRLALAGITLLTQLFSRSRMVRNDGPLSVRRAFTRGELTAMLDKLPHASYTLAWRWAFRWLAVIRKGTVHDH